MSKLCIIPARGGSKRIPRKNIKDFLGKPIIAYSIEVALKSGLFDEVMVSTDDDEIEKIALDCGAKVPFKRTDKNSDDYATTIDVIEEVINNYAEIGTHFQFICCIYPAAPLINEKHLKAGLDQIIAQKNTCVFPVVEFSYPIWRSFEIGEKGNIELFWSEHINTRSQDLKKAYHDAGQWYWFDSQLLTNWNWPENTGSIILQEFEAQDIDTLSDWKIAEIKYSVQKKNIIK